MADSKTPRKWSLEEIDELLQDSGMLPRDDGSLDMVEEIAPSQKTEAFDPRPSHNEKIKHKIIKDTVEKSEGAAEPQVYGNLVSEIYRERFINNPSDNINKTLARTMVIPETKGSEQGGFIKKTGNFPLVSEKKDAEVDQKTRVQDNSQHTKTVALRSLAVTDGDAHDVELPIEEDNLQLSFEGFHEEISEQVDERQVEEELIKKRKEKVSSFTINSEITAQEEEPQIKRYGTDEYRTPDDKFKVQYYLKKKKSTSLIGMVCAFAVAFVLFILSALSSGISAGGKGYIIASLVLTLLSCAVNFDFILDGLKSLKALKFNKNTGCIFALAATVIQLVAFFCASAPFETGLSMLSACAVMYLGFNIFGEYLEYRRIGENFSYIANQESLYSIGYISEEQTAEQIGKGLLQEPIILSSQRTLFPARFIENSRKYYSADEISSKTIKIGLIASVIVGLLTLLIHKNIFSAITAFTACVLVCMPYILYIADSIAIWKISRKARKRSCVIAGWQALRLCKKANAIAVDSGDIFHKEGGNVSGIHLFYDISVDEAIVYAATLAIEAGGPLGNLFKRVIVGETSLLPEADTLVYEDKFGLSAWIFNRRVHVGNEDLMRNHIVEIPDKALIIKRTGENEYPLYLAIDGKAAAVFIVSYDADGESRELLRKIEESNISLLVRSTDANVTDTSVAQTLTLPQSGVKVISAISGDVYKSYIKETTSAADSLLMHDGDAKSFLYAVKNALSLGEIKGILSTFQICAMGIGVAIVGTLSFVAGASHISCFQLMVIELFFTALCTGAMLLGDKKKADILKSAVPKKKNVQNKKKTKKPKGKK